MTFLVLGVYSLAIRVQQELTEWCDTWDSKRRCEKGRETKRRHGWGSSPRVRGVMEERR
jgi:hypothetical protein